MLSDNIAIYNILTCLEKNKSRDALNVFHTSIAPLPRSDNTGFLISGSSTVLKRLYLLGSKVEDLPIFPYQTRIVQCLLANQIMCIMADTGSGKSTLLPTFMAKMEGGMRVVVATPTISSARNLSEFTRRHYPDLKIGFAGGGSVEYDSSHNLVYVTAGHLYHRLGRRHAEKRPLGSNDACLKD